MRGSSMTHIMQEEGELSFEFFAIRNGDEVNICVSFKRNQLRLRD